MAPLAFARVAAASRGLRVVLLATFTAALLLHAAAATSTAAAPEPAGGAPLDRSANAQSAARTTSFSSLTLVGERWDNGQWARLAANGTILGYKKPDGTSLKRGDAGATLIVSPRQSPGLLSLSASTVLCSANDTTQVSTDGGRSWARSPGACVQLPPSVPAPGWMRRQDPGAAFMDIQPIHAFLPGCYMPPKGAKGCQVAASVTAAAKWKYTDWGLANHTARARQTVGRKRPNAWSGLPAAVSELCTSCGGGTQLPDGSYVYLAVVEFGHDCPFTDCCNSVVAFASADGLSWHYTATVGAYNRTRVYQEGPNECDVVLLADNSGPSCGSTAGTECPPTAHCPCSPAPAPISGAAGHPRRHSRRPCARPSQAQPCSGMARC